MQTQQIGYVGANRLDNRVRLGISNANIWTLDLELHMVCSGDDIAHDGLDIVDDWIKLE